MKTNLEALKAVYVKNGGSLTDTYEDIAGGAPVSAYKTLKDAIAALSKLTLLPEVTDADNGKIMQVESGEWTPVEPSILSNFPAELQTLIQTAAQTNLPGIIQGAGKPYIISVSWIRADASDQDAFDALSADIIEVVNNMSIPAYDSIGCIITKRNNVSNNRYEIAFSPTIETVGTYKFIVSHMTVTFNKESADTQNIMINIIIAFLSEAS